MLTSTKNVVLQSVSLSYECLHGRMKNYEIYILYCSCLKYCDILSQLYVPDFHLNQKNLSLGDQSDLNEFQKLATSLTVKVIDT